MTYPVDSAVPTFEQPGPDILKADLPPFEDYLTYFNAWVECLNERLKWGETVEHFQAYSLILFFNR